MINFRPLAFYLWERSQLNRDWVGSWAGIDISEEENLLSLLWFEPHSVLTYPGSLSCVNS
jgi:hypothetical protein